MHADAAEAFARAAALGDADAPAHAAAALSRAAQA
jgi:hypothetical protein